MAGAARGSFHFYVEATPNIDTSQYAAGDLVGDAALSFPGAVLGEVDQVDKHGGIIQSVIVTDLGKQSADLDIVFFDSDPADTTFTDNAALDVADTDLTDIVGVAQITTWIDFNDNSVGQALNFSLPFVLDSGNTLYAAIVSRGTPTYVSASDLTVRIGVLRT